MSVLVGTQIVGFLTHRLIYDLPCIQCHILHKDSFFGNFANSCFHIASLNNCSLDRVAIPLNDYLIPNCRGSKFIHPMAYRQIRTSTSYQYRFFPRSVVHRNALPTSIAMRPHDTDQSLCLPGGACIRP